MKKRPVASFIVGAMAVGVLLVGSVAHAGTNSDTLSAQFVDCCCLVCPPPTDPSDPCWVCPPSGPVPAPLAPSDVTGAVPSANWNNAFGMIGEVKQLARDTNGVAMTTDASVMWSATNTWSSTGRGEENNNFTGPDHDLMRGYLDQNTPTPSTTIIQFTNIPADMAINYDVIIYTLGGVPNRGGEYTVNGSAPKFVVASGNGVFNGPDFIEALGDDPAFGTNDWGNFVAFRGMSGDSVMITATNTFGDVPRAPINGVQIVNQP